MNRVDYYWARTLLQITSIVFFPQLILEASGILTRKPGFEWVIYACAIAFLASLIYAVALVVINALRKQEGDGMNIAQAFFYNWRMKSAARKLREAIGLVEDNGYTVCVIVSRAGTDYIRDANGSLHRIGGKP